ncbi:MAG: ABC transporter ATP-binding protein [Polyangiaceae bacterium]|nr:ABC transporter ATP-binding protein [Polyangiaceae bacterium]
MTQELRHEGRFRWVVLASVVATGFGHAAVAGAGAGLIRGVTGHSGAVELTTWGLIGLFASLLKTGGGFGMAHAQAALGSRVASALRVDIARSLLGVGRAAPSQAVLARIAVGLREVELGARGAVVWARAVGQLLPLAIALIFVSGPLAIAAALALLPIVWAVARLRRRFKSAAAGALASAEQLHGHVDELVTNLDLFRSYGAGGRVLGALTDAGRRSEREVARLDALGALLSGLNETLGALLVVLVVLLSERVGFQVADGRLLAFCVVLFMAYRPLKDLGEGRAVYLRGQQALARLPTQATDEAPAPRRAPFTDAGLTLDAFGCEGRGPQLSLTLAQGEVLWITGPNGSGKTTLLRTLLGLEPAVGVCRVGEREVTSAPAGPAHRPFAWVPQEAPLITGTLIENLTLLGVTPDAGRAALATLGAEWLIERLGEERLGPGGRAVSGGERRLIALARAVATELPILLLDEPFAGLDDAAREQLRDALTRLRGARTLIVVSHDPAPQRFATRRHAIVTTLS